MEEREGEFREELGEKQNKFKGLRIKKKKKR